MLAGLRHDGIVRRDDEDGEIDARGAGKHILDEAFVARNVDDTQAKLTQIERCEADINGDAARLFFGQTVAIDSGEGFDERRLAVIDVPSSAEDQVARHGPGS